MTTTPERKRLTRIVRCPTCQKSVRYDLENAWRPFCSDRCKTLDIAAWADESFRIPGPASDGAVEEEEKKPSDDDEGSGGGG